jgi:hypothetical protein
MSEPEDLKQKLLDRIKAKQAGINVYARSLEQRGVRLTNLSIICTSLTTVLTAGPALGGTKFTGSTSAILGLASDSIVWQVLCLGAVVLSLAAAIISNMNKSTESATRLAKAQTAAVLLERLEMNLALDQVTVDAAAKQFQDYIAEAPFIPDTSAR